MSKFGKDLWERIAVTVAGGFVAGFAGGLIAPGNLNVSTSSAALLGAVTAGIAGAVSAFKGIIAKNFGNTDSASLNPEV